MNKVFYLVQNRDKIDNAAFKAPVDIEEICRRRGYIKFEIDSFPVNKNKLFQKLWLAFYCVGWWMKLFNRLDQGDIVIYQHPLYGIRIAMKWITKAQEKKQCKFIALLHDLPSLRGHIKGNPKGNQNTDKLSDTELLKCFDAIICHNDKMRNYMIEQGFDENKLISLGIFDYLTCFEGNSIDRKPSCSVAVAGNLNINKSGYIYKMKDDKHNAGLEINLFGSNISKDYLKKDMVWHGSFDPEELPSRIKGSFGIVWDGDSAETCTGNTGEYLRYNNPHKTSLYLAAGLPVIIWKEAAMAEFIEKNRVGISINSLFEVEEAIRKISEEEYTIMCSNVTRISGQLKKGFYFSEAVDKAIYLVSNNRHSDHVGFGQGGC